MYSRQQTEKELKQILQKPYDPLTLFRWADRLYITGLEELSSELNDLLSAVEALSLDKNCEYTEEQLNLLAEKLINKIEKERERIVNHKAAKKKLYTRRQIGKELKRILKEPYDPIIVANWAEDLYLHSPVDTSPELNHVLYALEMMQADESFEYTEEQLNILADKLMNNEENALKQVHKMFKIFEEWQPDEAPDPREEERICD